MEEQQPRPAVVRQHIGTFDRAMRRARALLLTHLTPEQQKTFEESNWFVVTGGKSGRRYMIHGNTYAGNVALLRREDDKAEARYCCHSETSIPLADHLLAQKLMLEANEELFLKLANKRAA